MYTIKCKLERKIPICGLKKRWPDLIGEDPKTPECKIGRESFNISRNGGMVAKAKYFNRVINASDDDDYDELIMQN